MASETGCDHLDLVVSSTPILIPSSPVLDQSAFTSTDDSDHLHYRLANLFSTSPRADTASSVSSPGLTEEPSSLPGFRPSPLDSPLPQSVTSKTTTNSAISTTDPIAPASKRPCCLCRVLRYLFCTSFSSLEAETRSALIQFIIISVIILLFGVPGIWYLEFRAKDERGSAKTLNAILVTTGVASGLFMAFFFKWLQAALVSFASCQAIGLIISHFAVGSLYQRPFLGILMLCPAVFLYLNGSWFLQLISLILFSLVVVTAAVYDTVRISKTALLDYFASRPLPNLVGFLYGNMFALPVLLMVVVAIRNVQSWRVQKTLSEVAEQVVSLELDSPVVRKLLDSSEKKCTRVELALRKVVNTVLEYRRFLPMTLRQEMIADVAQDDEEEDESSANAITSSGSSNNSNASSNASRHSAEKLMNPMMTDRRYRRLLQTRKTAMVLFDFSECFPESLSRENVLERFGAVLDVVQRSIRHHCPRAVLDFSGYRVSVVINAVSPCPAPDLHAIQIAQTAVTSFQETLASKDLRLFAAVAVDDKPSLCGHVGNRDVRRFTSFSPIRELLSGMIALSKRRLREPILVQDAIRETARFYCELMTVHYSPELGRVSCVLRKKDRGHDDEWNYEIADMLLEKEDPAQRDDSLWEEAWDLVCRKSDDDSAKERIRGAFLKWLDSPRCKGMALEEVRRMAVFAKEYLL